MLVRTGLHVVAPGFRPKIILIPAPSPSIQAVAFLLGFNGTTRGIGSRLTIEFLLNSALTCPSTVTRTFSTAHPIAPGSRAGIVHVASVPPARTETSWHLRPP